VEELFLSLFYLLLNRLIQKPTHCSKSNFFIGFNH
jgi:hypothetical protein